MSSSLTPLEESWYHEQLFHGVVTTMATQVKERFHHDHYPMNMFFPLAIEVFWCFHQQIGNFVIDVLTWCG